MVGETKSCWAGDYITTSSVPGYGEMQDDDRPHSYTPGKAVGTVDFDQADAIISHNGKRYKAYLPAVAHTSGQVVRTHGGTPDSV